MPKNKVEPCASVSPVRWIVPAGQSKHLTAPVVLTYFAVPWYEQGTQLICPLRELDVPTGHGAHAFASPETRNDPGGQGSHWPRTVVEPIVVFAASTRTNPPRQDTAQSASVASYALPVGHEGPACVKTRPW
jgi:hypothetical protein